MCLAQDQKIAGLRDVLRRGAPMAPFAQALAAFLDELLHHGKHGIADPLGLRLQQLEIIGRGVAMRAAKEGAKVLLADRSEYVRETEDKIGEQACACVCDLETYEGAKAAVSGMIELLSKRYNMNPVDAYMLCSVCGDLRISEIVDQPNWVVSFYFPRVVLG